MDIFSRLLRLHSGIIPTEDFFTEIVAHLLRENNDLLYRWLESMNLPLPHTTVYTSASVSTQKWFKALETHDQWSRPDIVIELVDGEHRDWIIIESKLGAMEGSDQLKRYAEVLSAAPDIRIRHRILLYITRDYDPKDTATILAGIPFRNVHFQQSRWHHFYHMLAKETDNPLVQQTLKFMEAQKMATNNQFRPEDLITFANLTHALNMMQETLANEVKNSYMEKVGPSNSDSQIFRQMLYHNRYLRQTWLNKAQWWFGIGYFLHTPYPSLGFIIEVSPQSPQRAVLIEAMNAITLQMDWRSYGLNDPSAWSGITYKRSLSEFLTEEDHVLAIKAFFLQALNEFTAVKQLYPHLPWSEG